MNNVFYPKKINGNIAAPPSKSYSHRYLLCSLLSDGNTSIENCSMCGDVRETIEVISDLGCMVSYDSGMLTVYPSDRQNSSVINIENSGATLRLIIPVICALNKRVRIKTGDNLAMRPLSHLLNELNAHGARIITEEDILDISGGLEPGIFEIPGDITSQYISGLLFALPLLSGDSEIRLKTPLESSPYVDMTIECLKSFDIHVSRDDEGFSIAGRQRYICQDEIKVNGDWSGSAFMLSAGAIAGKVAVSGLKDDSQGDKIIIDILKTAGAKVRFDGRVATAEKSALMPFDVDIRETPDLAPVVSILASCAKGTSRIRNISRLRYKESNRIESITDMLESLGIDHKIENDNLIIKGGTLKSCLLDSHSDHRIAMSGIVASSVTDGPVTINDIDCISKSYPGFAEDYISL